MKIRVVSVCYNEAGMLPFYLRHYASFADEIIIYDDQSDDGSRDIIAKEPKAQLHECPFKGLDDTEMMALWYRELRKADCDWLMIPDIDEILYTPVGMRSFLEAHAAYCAIRSVGANMTCNGLPRDDGRQIYEIAPMGVRAPVYAKTIVVRPNCGVEWTTGRHHLHVAPGCTTDYCADTLKLLHYRYLGEQYTAARNARNYDRVGENKGAAWSNAPGYYGEHSPLWAERIRHDAFNVLQCDHGVLRGTREPQYG